MLRAVQALQSTRQLGFSHLRELNPYVQSTLDTTAQSLDSGSASSTAACSAARQPGPLQGQAADNGSAQQARCGGVSAFAFQGTNAHVTLASAPPAAGAALVRPASSPLWQRRRYWYLPEPHALLSRATGRGTDLGTATFELQLTQPRLAYLSDHRVRMHNRAAVRQ